MYRHLTLHTLPASLHRNFVNEFEDLQMSGRLQPGQDLEFNTSLSEGLNVGNL
jgi:hypothetical protein